MKLPRPQTRQSTRSTKGQITTKRYGDQQEREEQARRTRLQERRRAIAQAGFMANQDQDLIPPSIAMAVYGLKSY